MRNRFIEISVLIPKLVGLSAMGTHTHVSNYKLTTENRNNSYLPTNHGSHARFLYRHGTQGVMALRLWLVSVFCPDWHPAVLLKIHKFCPDRDQAFAGINGGSWDSLIIN